MKIAPSGAATTAITIYFSIDPTTVPSWLQVSQMNGSPSASAAVSVTFTASPLAANNPEGTYTASVHVQSVGFPDAVINVTMNEAAAPTVTAALTITPSTWNIGTAAPTGGSAWRRSTSWR